MQALLEVLVRTDDDDGPFVAVAGGEGGYAVVGFAAVRDFKRQPQRRDHAADGFQLLHQRFGSRCALRLVEWKEVVAECRPLAIQHEGEMARLLFTQQPQEDARDDEQGVGRKAVRPLHVLEGVEPPEDEGRAIHEP